MQRGGHSWEYRGHQGRNKGEGQCEHSEVISRWTGVSSSLNLGHANPLLLNRFIKQSYLNPEACLAPFLTRSVIFVTMAEGRELESF